MMRSRLVATIAVAVVTLVSLPSHAATVRILQTNSAGDNIHIIDPGTNKVVGIVSGIEVNHGATATPDGKWYWSMVTPYCLTGACPSACGPAPKMSRRRG